MPGLIFFVVFVVVAAAVAWYFENERRKAFAAVAAGLGLRFTPGRVHGLEREYRFLDDLRKGDSRKASNRIEGIYSGEHFDCFDYQFSTGSGKNRSTHHFSVFTIRLPGSFPELRVFPEGFFSKIVQSIGFEDIDFESAEFSRRYVVKSRDKKFAYDFFNPRMIAFFLDNETITAEVEGSVLAIARARRIRPDMIERQLNLLLGIRRQIPEYLLN